MHTPAPRTIGLRTTEVTYPGGTEHIRTVRTDLCAVLDICPRGRRCDPVRLRTRGQRRPAQQLPPPGGTFAVRTVISPDHYARIESRTEAAPGTSPWSTRRGITVHLSVNSAPVVYSEKPKLTVPPENLEAVK